MQRIVELFRGRSSHMTLNKTVHEIVVLQKEGQSSLFDEHPKTYRTKCGLIQSGGEFSFIRTDDGVTCDGCRDVEDG